VTGEGNHRAPLEAPARSFLAGVWHRGRERWPGHRHRPLHGAFRVLAVDPNQYLVLGPQAVWTVALYPQPDGTTRMVQRLRMRYFWRRVYWAVMIDIGDFVMMRKMLLNLKERAESFHAQ
jgi:hypothetical protein